VLTRETSAYSFPLPILQYRSERLLSETIWVFFIRLFFLSSYKMPCCLISPVRLSQSVFQITTLESDHVHVFFIECIVQFEYHCVGAVP
jgi:hypothetical protein